MALMLRSEKGNTIHDVLHPSQNAHKSSIAERSGGLSSLFPRPEALLSQQLGQLCTPDDTVIILSPVRVILNVLKW